jgi:hypothetical protein
MLNSFWGYLHLPPPPPPPPQEPPVLQQDPIQAVPVEHQAEQVELFEEVEVVDEINEDPVIVDVVDLEVRDDDDDNDIEIVAEVPAPERRRRRRARREFDDEEYEVECVLDRRYFHGVEHFLIEWSGYGQEENSWELGYEKRVEIPEAIALYFHINGIADDGIMILRSRDEEFVEDRQPRERPFLARAAKRPRFS